MLCAKREDLATSFVLDKTTIVPPHLTFASFKFNQLITIAVSIQFGRFSVHDEYISYYTI